MTTLPIADIVVGERRREDYGDIDGLAASIEKFGLLHPVVVDDDGNLVAGERRLRACRQLGWTSVETTSLGLLTDAARREIELEENLRRKDLTSYERSKTLVKLVEVATEVARTDPKTMPESGRVSARGPLPDPASEKRIAERIGVPRQTIQEAKAHVTAVDTYPELIQFTKTDAVKVAAKLDAMPEEERVETRAKVMVSDAPTLAALTDRPPPASDRSVYEEAVNDPGARWTRNLNKLKIGLRTALDDGAFSALCGHWDREVRILAAKEMDELMGLMADWRGALLEGIEDANG